MMLCPIKVVSGTARVDCKLDTTSTEPPRPSAHLDPVEIPVGRDTCFAGADPIDAETGLADNFRHSCWRARRAKVLRAMHNAGTRPARQRAFARCGSDHWIMQHNDDHQRFKVIAAHCHDRFCTPCAVDRQALIRRNISGRLRDQPHRLLTLTIRHADEGLTVLLNRLLRAFRLLRQRSLWRQRVTGGASFVEITYNPATTQWNPHLHCLLEGRYIPRPELSQLWLAITGDSQNVHIELIRTRRAAIDYVTKYATKPLPSSVFADDDALTEVVDALSKRRLVLCFGTWRNWRLLTDRDTTDWHLYGALSELHHKAASNHWDARCILDMLLTADPATGEFFVDLDNPEPED